MIMYNRYKWGKKLLKSFLPHFSFLHFNLMKKYNVFFIFNQIPSRCILQHILDDDHSITSFLPLLKVFYPTDTFETVIIKPSHTFTHRSSTKVMITYITSTNYLLFQNYHEIYRTNMIYFSLLKNENPQSMHLFTRTLF